MAGESGRPEGAGRAAQFLSAVEVAQRYALWKKNQQPYSIPIDQELQKLVDMYGSSADDVLKNHFIDALAAAEAELDQPQSGGTESGPSEIPQ